MGFTRQFAFGRSQAGGEEAKEARKARGRHCMRIADWTREDELRPSTRFPRADPFKQYGNTGLPCCLSRNMGMAMYRWYGLVSYTAPCCTAPDMDSGSKKWEVARSWNVWMR